MLCGLGAGALSGCCTAWGWHAARVLRLVGRGASREGPGLTSTSPEVIRWRDTVSGDSTAASLSKNTIAHRENADASWCCIFRIPGLEAEAQGTRARYKYRYSYMPVGRCTILQV